MRFRREPRYRWLIWILVVGLVGVPTSPLFGQSPSGNDRGMVVASQAADGQSLLSKGIELYEQMEWERAVKQLKEALTQDLNAEEKAQVYWYLAVIAQAQDASQEAQAYLLELLRNKPDFTLPETLRGTDFEPLFKAALAQTDRIPPQIRLSPIGEVQQGVAIPVIAEVTDNSDIIQVELTYSVGQASPQSVRMTREAADRWRAEIPKSATQKPGAITLRISARDAWQNLANESTSVMIPEKKGGGHTLLYLVGGALVAIGGGVAAALLGSGGGEAPPGDNPPPEDTWPSSTPPGPPQ